MVLNKHKLGDFRDSVQFAGNFPIPKGAGQEDAYTTFFTCRGKLMNTSGRRGLQFSEIAGIDSYELYVRYTTDLWPALKNNGKVSINNVRYTIESFEKVDNLDHFIKFKLSKEVIA